MAQITASLLKDLRGDLDAALATVGQKHGVTLKGMNATYDREGTKATLKVEIRAILSGQVVDPKVTAFNRYCTLYGLKPTDLGATLRMRGDLLKITGLDTNRKKYPVYCENIRTGATKLYVAEDVVRALAIYRQLAPTGPVLVTPTRVTPPTHDQAMQATASRLAGELMAKQHGNGKVTTGTITFLTSTNPYKPGTKAAATYELMLENPSVEAFKAACAANPGKYDPSYLSWATQPHGKQPAYIAIK